MPVTHVPTPCAVYVRDPNARQHAKYCFSHFCEYTTQKLLPLSLRVSDLRALDANITNQQNAAHARKACFLVLVSGDVAQCVSISNANEKNRTKFLYHGSAFARSNQQHQRAFPTELHDNYVAMHFFATMAVFDAHSHRLSTIIPLECSVCLLPRHIQDHDLPVMAKWVEACMQRSLFTSIWVAKQGSSYNEWFRKCSRVLKKV